MLLFPPLILLSSTSIFIAGFHFARGVPTAGMMIVPEGVLPERDTDRWVDMDNAWEQKKPEARKILENRALALIPRLDQKPLVWKAICSRVPVEHCFPFPLIGKNVRCF